MALSSGFLATKIRKQQELVKIREKNNLALLNFTKDLAEAKTKLDAIQTTLDHIDKNLEINVTFLTPDIQLSKLS